MLELKDFYQQVFDLTEGYRPRFRRRGFWLYAGDKALLHLTESDEHQPLNQKNCLDHLAFDMRDMDGLLAKLKQGNIAYTLNPLKELRITQVFFTDPAGNGLEAVFADS